MRPCRLAVLVTAMVMCVCTAAAVCGTGQAAANPVRGMGTTRWVPRALLVEFRAGTGVDTALRKARAAGAATVETISAGAPAAHDGGAIVVVRSKSLDVAALRRLFAQDPSVLRTSPDYVRHAFRAVPDDPALGSQWGLLRVGTLDAWQTTTGTRDVVVADVDTGLSLAHPEFTDSLWRNAGDVPGNHLDDDGNGYVDDAYGWDATQSDGVPMDFNGHGTHTAGIIAASAGNGAGIAGVAPGASVMPVEALAENGYGDDAQILSAIDYVVREKAEGGVNVVAINASWGGGGANALLREAIERAGDAGIVFVAAAGNSHWDIDATPVYPAAFDCPTMITVAATGATDGLAAFSNYGATSVDLGAPGTGIVSAMTADGYARWDGTSMAAPFVTGAVALCAAEWPGETAAQRTARILASVRSAPSLAGKCATGGRLDIAAALRATPPGDDYKAPVTTVLGGDDARHDARVRLALAAVDEPGGSGVAGSEWRLGGGGWHHGSLVTVLPPKRRRTTVTVGYRSTDRAGNVETPGSVVVKFDRTRPADDAYPGVPLPASPVRDDVVAGSDPQDVFSLRLKAGQSVKLTMTASPASRILVGVFTAGARTFGFWETGVGGLLAKASSDGLEPGYGPFGSVWYGAVDTAVGPETLVWRCAADRTYRIVVRAESGGGPYALDYSVAPSGTDVVPPRIHRAGQRVRALERLPGVVERRGPGRRFGRRRGRDQHGRRAHLGGGR